MKAGSYVLHLYCDRTGCPWKVSEFSGENKRQAMRAARRAGWHIGQPWGESDFCKKHNPKGVKRWK